MRTQKSNQQTLETLVSYASSLGNLTVEEAKKMKTLFVRSAISDYKALRKKHKLNRKVLLVFYLIPILWLIIYMSNNVMKIEEENAREKILLAKELWEDELSKDTIQEIKDMEARLF
ncbi:MAG: hypothetical protein MK212_22420 [Saprospiraceae bacterium]|nr:hypothetical protein [Saprospiraceae bacterium]